MTQFSHGGDIYGAARALGRPPESFLDFSASINPLGPPAWLRDEIDRELKRVAHYPDPQSRALLEAAESCYGVPADELVPANGTTEVLHLLPRLAGLSRAVIPVPAYVDYEAACLGQGLGIRRLRLDPEKAFALDWDRLEALLDQPGLVFLGQPNNPTGRTLSVEQIRLLAARHPESLFVVDEAFADFIPGLERLVAQRPENVLVLLSLTKFYAVPGLRLGLAAAAPSMAERIRTALPPWTVNHLAQTAGAGMLRDTDYRQKTRQSVQGWRQELTEGLSAIAGLTVFPAEANFLLCRLDQSGLDASELAGRLLRDDSLIIRTCGNFSGLDHSYFRVAVRNRRENERLIAGLERILAPGDSRDPIRTPVQGAEPGRQVGTPAIMFQGLSSNAGKSVLTAALCRILLQDGYRVAPFKAQNMSLNSFVTRDGGEMGRAQVLQAQACRLEPEVIMNPVLLKPSSDTGSQVIVRGRPVASMDVRTYHRYKETAATEARRAYDELAAAYDVIVLEGAGSPAEINLKDHDLTNMAMAGYAAADVLLVGDIDRGGVFASFVGTMELLEAWERDLVAGFIINRFRGEEALLDPAIQAVHRRTGKPFYGVVPYLLDLGLPEEDSVTFKAGWGQTGRSSQPAAVEVACVDLPHISNFTDLDPFLAEPDVRLRIVRSLKDLEPTPDVLILPGSKNVLSDLAHLERSGLAEAVKQLAGTNGTEVVGICGGFQMLGQRVADPYGIESSQESMAGLGLLPVVTELAREKQLHQVRAVHHASGLELRGYEIHHGETRTLDDRAVCTVTAETDRPIGFAEDSGAVWGTYLHGLFDADEFRRRFIDTVRSRKGLKPLNVPQTRFDLEEKLDRLAEVVRGRLDMDRIYALLERSRSPYLPR